MPTKKVLEEQNAKLEQELAELKARAEREEEEIVALHTGPDPRLPHAYTDEGMAEAAADREARGVPTGHGITVGAEKFEKDLERQGDMLQEGAMPWETKEPFADTAAQHTPPGHTVRFLSTKHIDARGYRGWEPTRTEEGKQVMVGGMLMATMPKERAAQRNAFYRQKAQDRLRRTKELHAEATAQAKRDGMYSKGDELEVSRNRVDSRESLG